jgi:hypothetical protein
MGIRALAIVTMLASCTPRPAPRAGTCTVPADGVYADVRGSVVDDTKHPVAGARVSLARDPKSAKTTDAHGAFVLTRVTIGKTACGHEDLDTADVELDADENGRVGRARATLHRGDNQLPPIAIAVPDTDIPEVPPILGLTASATSSAKGYEPWYALGGDPKKMWCEGRADDGVGEALVLHLAEPTHIQSLVLRAGAWRSDDSFRAHNRITQIRVVTDTGGSKTVSLSEERVNVDVAMGRDRVQEVRLEIAAVTKGKTNDTCISGVELKTDPASTVVLGEAPSSSLANAFAKVWRAFASCDDKAFQAALQLPFVTSHRFGDAGSVRAACKSGEFADFRPNQVSPFVRAESPGKAAVIAGKLEWHFVLVGNAWRLASLEQTP